MTVSCAATSVSGEDRQGGDEEHGNGAGAQARDRYRRRVILVSRWRLYIYIHIYVYIYIYHARVGCRRALESGLGQR